MPANRLSLLASLTALGAEFVVLLHEPGTCLQATKLRTFRKTDWGSVLQKISFLATSFM